MVSLKARLAIEDSLTELELHVCCLRLAAASHTYHYTKFGSASCTTILTTIKNAVQLYLPCLPTEFRPDSF